jgi:hypothetical protein
MIRRAPGRGSIPRGGGFFFFFFFVVNEGNQKFNSNSCIIHQSSSSSSSHTHYIPQQAKLQINREKAEAEDVQSKRPIHKINTSNAITSEIEAMNVLLLFGSVSRSTTHFSSSPGP